MPREKRERNKIPKDKIDKEMNVLGDVLNYNYSKWRTFVEIPTK